MWTEIKVPKIAGVLILYVGRWFKSVGDPVTIGEPVVEIDTYNMTHEIKAPATGILSKIAVRDGGFVEPGQYWARLIRCEEDVPQSDARTSRRHADRSRPVCNAD